MVAAYFSPSTGMLRRIRHIARRGEVQLVMASKSDNTATVSAARYLYKKLLGAGARIWEYQPCKLHMKLIVIDDAVYIGSANFDMRSLFINLELMLRIEDKDFAETMRGFIAGRQAESAEITAAYERRHFSGLSRLNGWLSYLLVGTLDYTVTRRLNFRATAKP